MKSNLTTVVRILLFISSYLPLLFIFYLQNLKTNLLLSIFFISLGIMSTVGIVLFLNYINTTSSRTEKVAQIQRKDTEVIAYIFTYIFPFLQLNFGDLVNLLSLGIFFIILGVIYINSSMICINPTLNMLGYHLYEIETPEGYNHTLLARKKRVLKNTELDVVIIGDDLMVEKSE
jgi:hypothetical protein